VVHVWSRCRRPTTNWLRVKEIEGLERRSLRRALLLNFLPWAVRRWLTCEMIRRTPRKHHKAPKRPGVFHLGYLLAHIHRAAITLAYRRDHNRRP
jgi:hypothetical protein